MKKKRPNQAKAPAQTKAPVDPPPAPEVPPAIVSPPLTAKRPRVWPRRIFLSLVALFSLVIIARLLLSLIHI